ncbi:MAG: hypothetical protein ACXWL2_04430 [Candidatus Chromulinivorax sp.]
MITKKNKPKKETITQVKQDIADILESLLRQVGKNITQLVHFQDELFNVLKDLFDEQDDRSAADWKVLREKCQHYASKLEQHQVDLDSFLYDTKSKL